MTKIITTDTNKTFETALRLFVSGQGFRPDFFGDIECFYSARWDEDEGAWAMTQADLYDFIDWWQDAVDTANRGVENMDGLSPLTEDEISRGWEYILTVEEV